MNRMDVMVYSLMVGTFTLLASGFCLDLNWRYTGAAFAVISVCALLVALLGYLSPDTRNVTQGD
jgi:membrane protein implicated in regulation of membrane protease activity